MRAAVRILLVNILVAAGLLLAFELCYRTTKFIASCVSESCDGSYWVPENKFRRNVDIGLSRRDATLGHVPNDGVFTIRSPAARPARVTIRDGVRVNNSEQPYTSLQATLAVGDSFTFGDEVSDAETWPACLERQWSAKVVNGGVFGYGAAQAVLRARELERKQDFHRVIWSILLEHDFERDRLVGRSSTPRPAVVSDGNGMRFSSIQESERILRQTTQNGIARYAHLFGYLYTTKLAWQHLSKLVLPPGVRYEGRWDVPHPQAASMPDLMRFSFDQFAALEAEEKYVLIQYAAPSVSTLSPKAAAELANIKELAAQRGIVVIDSLPMLKLETGAAPLYEKHHTPAGNRAVCQSVVVALRRAPAAAMRSARG